jgi:Flp pilus assembly protein TadD
VPALNNLAWNYAEHGGNITTALAHARTAQTAEPNNPEVADTLGWIYFRTRDYSKAVDLLKESAEKIPDNPVIRYHLGLACYKKGDIQCAKEALQQALRLSRIFQRQRMPNRPGGDCCRTSHHAVKGAGPAGRAGPAAEVVPAPVA